MQEKLDLTDLRLVAAILREGGLSQAARALGVNHSTAFRRLGALEERLNEELFDRRAGHYEPSATALMLAESAGRLEEEMLALERRLAGKDGRVEGRVRITAPDDIAQELLPTALARLRSEHPGLLLELAIDNQLLSLTHREADIALRPTRAPEETLVGRAVGKLSSALYCASGLTPEHAKAWAADPGAAPWIGWEEGRGPPAFATLRAERWPEAPLVYTTSSMLHQARAVAEGMGVALLPAFLAEGDPRLTRIGEAMPELDSDLWLLTHADLRAAPRIRACLDVIYDTLRAQRTRLSP